ncbi:hypothetical protein Tco_1053815 [Tanacetum coccineum]|uniref:Uncharacterized protein n=1 Tax=Tanacetum coccineum TaxID=301880 RepID=A0ABQ5GV43_9ASTR
MVTIPSLLTELTFTYLVLLVSDDESVKRQKIEDDAEKEALKAYLDIILGDDEAVNVESLATKYLIVYWKTHALSEDKMYSEIIRGDGKMLSRMLSRRLEVDHECEMAYELLRGGLLGIRGFYDLMLLVQVCAAVGD